MNNFSCNRSLYTHKTIRDSVQCTSTIMYKIFAHCIENSALQFFFFCDWLFKWAKFQIQRHFHHSHHQYVICFVVLSAYSLLFPSNSPETYRNKKKRIFFSLGTFSNSLKHSPNFWLIIFRFSCGMFHFSLPSLPIRSICSFIERNNNNYRSPKNNDEQNCL